MTLVKFKDLPDKTTALTAENLNHNFEELQGKILGYEVINEIGTVMLSKNSEQQVQITQSTDEKKVVVNEVDESHES